MELRRHSLLEITAGGREFAFARLQKQVSCPREVEQIKKVIFAEFTGKRLPAIVRRQEKAGQGLVAVGFVPPYLQDDKRVRIAAFVPEKEIERVITPYEVLLKPYSARTQCLQALKRLQGTAADLGIKLGVWGSASLEIYTDLPYTHSASDLDLLLLHADLETLKGFYLAARRAGERFGCRIDAEVELFNGYDVKIGELLRETGQVLGKSIFDVQLMPRMQAINLLGNGS